jgi:hypothetical protein
MRMKAVASRRFRVRIQAQCVVFPRRSAACTKGPAESGRARRRHATGTRLAKLHCSALVIRSAGCKRTFFLFLVARPTCSRPQL